MRRISFYSSVAFLLWTTNIGLGQGAPSDNPFGQRRSIAEVRFTRDAIGLCPVESSCRGMGIDWLTMWLEWEIGYAFAERDLLSYQESLGLRIESDSLRRLDVFAKGDFSTLRFLELKCSRLQDMSGIERLPNLEVLVLWYCDDIADLQTVSVLKNLKALVLWHCAKLKDLDSLRGNSSVTHMGLYSFEESFDASAVSTLPNLVSLGTSLNVRDLHEVLKSGLKPIERIEYLELDDCQAMSSQEDFVPDVVALLQDMRQLKSLSMHVTYRQLQAICESAAIDNLQALELSVLTSGLSSPDIPYDPKAVLPDIAPLARLKKLRHLDLSSVYRVDDMSAVKSLHHLRSLQLPNMWSFTDNQRKD